MITVRSIAMLVLVGCGRLQFAPLPADDAALAGDEGPAMPRTSIRGSSRGFKLVRVRRCAM